MSLYTVFSASGCCLALVCKSIGTPPRGLQVAFPPFRCQGCCMGNAAWCGNRHVMELNEILAVVCKRQKQPHLPTVSVPQPTTGRTSLQQTVIVQNTSVAGAHLGTACCSWRVALAGLMQRYHPTQAVWPTMHAESKRKKACLSRWGAHGAGMLGHHVARCKDRPPQKKTGAYDCSSVANHAHSPREACLSRWGHMPKRREDS